MSGRHLLPSTGPGPDGGTTSFQCIDVATDCDGGIFNCACASVKTCGCINERWICSCVGSDGRMAPASRLSARKPVQSAQQRPSLRLAAQVPASDRTHSFGLTCCDAASRSRMLVKSKIGVRSAAHHQ